MLELISETWSRGPSLIPSHPDRGRPIILGSGPYHTAQYISFDWLTNRGWSDTHHQSKKDPISLCESDGMRHCLCTAIVIDELLFPLRRRGLRIKCDNKPYGISFYFSLRSGFSSSSIT
jgi:hypothetical protein